LGELILSGKSQKDKKASYLYFLYKMHEYFNDTHNTVKKKRIDSLVFLLEDCIELHQEITISDNKDRLNNILANLYENIKHIVHNNPIYKHNRLKRDIEKLLEFMAKLDNNYSLYNSVSSFTKRMKVYDFIEIYLDILENNELSFGEIDRMLDCLISDLVYRGFSIKFLDEWWNEKIKTKLYKNKHDEESLKGLIHELTNLKLEKRCFSFIIRPWLPKDLMEEIQENGFIKVQNIKFSIIDDVVFSDIKTILKLEEKQSNQKILVKAEIFELDQYKGIDTLTRTLENHLQIFRYISKLPKNIFDNTYLLLIEGDKWIEKRLDSSREDMVIKVNDRYKDDIKDFIELRRSLNISNNIFDLQIIERALGSISALEGSSNENQILGLWYSVEYIVGLYNKNSIIEKVRNVVPKVICLYLIKDKINILWDRLTLYSKKYKQLLNEESPLLYLFFEQCTDSGNPEKYGKEEVLNFLTSEKANYLYMEIKNNITIQREIAEINSLLIKPKNLLAFIKYTEDSIKFDLNRIYRIRNKLVHSGGNMPPNLSIITSRLFAYVHSLLGTIIYHMKRNPELTILEVIHSIQNTYEWYIKELQNGPNQDLMEMAMPKYLFL
jgi:hypothetical protein